MVVRVLVELRREEKTIGSPAILNTGYEAGEPEVHVPLSLSRLLGFDLRELRVERYRVVGSEVTTYTLGSVEVRAVAEGRGTEWMEARAVMVPGEYEVILSDALIEALGIEILRPKRGLWRFAGESKSRESVEARHWVE